MATGKDTRKVLTDKNEMLDIVMDMESEAEYDVGESDLDTDDEEESFCRKGKQISSDDEEITSGNAGNELNEHQSDLPISSSPVPEANYIHSEPPESDAESPKSDNQPVVVSDQVTCHRQTRSQRSSGNSGHGRKRYFYETNLSDQSSDESNSSNSPAVSPARASRGAARGGSGRGVRTRGGGRTRGVGRAEVRGSSSTPSRTGVCGRGRVRTRGGSHRGGARGGARGRGGRGRGEVYHQELQAAQKEDDLKKWKWEIIEETEIPADNIPFYENVGLKVRMNSQSPIAFLQLYWTDDMFRLLVTETNRYAKQFMEDSSVLVDYPDNYISKWVDTDIEEMKKFIGIVFLMGIIYKPSIAMYWSTNELLETPAFSKIMSRNRFQLILKFLHFNDNRLYDPTDEDCDRLHKVRTLIDIMRDCFQNVYAPEQKLSVDESLVLFKGRLRFRQYIKTKRARFGIKLYELTTHDGITLDFLVYCGKGMYYDDNFNDLPASERIPVALMQPYFDKNHILFTDNYYTSPSLAKFLIGHGTHLVGTIRTNRKNFAYDLIDTNLEKGQASFAKLKRYEAKQQEGQSPQEPQQNANMEDPEDIPHMIITKYRAVKDKANKKPKVVHLLSTFHNSKMVGTGKNQDNNPVRKPSMITDYNKHMGGVDMVDQQLHGLHTLRKSYKWYKKLAFRLMSQAALNSHKVFCKIARHYRTSNRKFLSGRNHYQDAGSSFSIFESCIA